MNNTKTRINISNLSVVVQGAVNKGTKKSLKSIRKHLPDAELSYQLGKVLILANWIMIFW